MCLIKGLLKRGHESVSELKEDWGDPPYGILEAITRSMGRRNAAKITKTISPR